MKKIISTVMVAILITSQIGCAGKVTKISEPMDQIKFDKDYKYTVKLKTGEETKEVSGNQLQGKFNQLIVQSASQTKTLMTQDIQNINGESTVRNGSRALSGLGVGAATGFVIGSVLGVTVMDGLARWDCSESPQPCDHSAFEIFGKGLVLGGLPFAAAGGLLGLGIGALIPKHNRVQITPIIEPTKIGSINAGANLGVTF